MASPGALGGVIVTLAALTVAMVALAWMRRPFANRESRQDKRPHGHGSRQHLGRLLVRSVSSDDSRSADLLDSLARGLRAGRSIEVAMDLASADTSGPVSVEWRRLLGEVRSGSSLGEVTRRWARTCPDADSRLIAATLSISIDYGGPRAQAIEALASTVRGRHALRQEIRGFAVQARLSAAVITVAPLVFTSIAVASDTRTRHVMMMTAAGRVCLAAGLAVDAFGWWWMNRICERVGGPTW